jgi:PAT family beta-lactamase induction signal transducer AmpG
MALADPRDALDPWCGARWPWRLARPRRTLRWTPTALNRPTRERQAALAATYQTGYRLAMIWAGAGVLWMAARAEVAAVPSGNYQHAAWQTAYLVMAASMLVGVVTVLLSREPARAALPPARNAAEWLQGALVDPFADFIRRYRWQAALILGLIAVYRISDVVMGIMANPFYVDMGYTKDEVAAVTKVYGVIMTLAGAFMGGALSMRWA